MCFRENTQIFIFAITIFLRHEIDKSIKKRLEADVYRRRETRMNEADAGVDPYPKIYNQA